MSTRARDRLPQPTDRLPLGASGLEVSPICLGLVEDPDTIAAAFSAGINFFFLTADMHWPLYEPARRGLARLLARHPRDSIVVAVVSYVAQPEFLWVPFQEVRDAVAGLERIDVTIAGGAYGHEIDGRLATFARHRDLRHVGARAIGASFHDREAARRVIADDKIEIAFARYSPLHPGASDDLFPHVGVHGDDRQTLLFNFKTTTGYLASDAHYAALGIDHEYWRPRITDYYRFALAEPALDGILCALPGPRAVDELVEALAAGPLDDEGRQYLRDLGALKRGGVKVT
jgi:hypothetical protein